VIYRTPAPSARNNFVVLSSMHSFRARIERGRIIVHEPIDLPDGVVYLVVLDKDNADPANDPAGGDEPAAATGSRAGVPPAQRDHRSSS
jgi:hypothetical protein